VAVDQAVAQAQRQLAEQAVQAARAVLMVAAAVVVHGNKQAPEQVLQVLSELSGPETLVHSHQPVPVHHN
jgi:hypothetical protein